ncbi:DDE-type integrase/transposase/recombinase [Campylobacter devanensis]|uniref:DDE-type integrase/transposase/recombinase n=1 Tax=Campylobacter devanensis TaxID=3161138 RepID=UPI000A34CB1B|nr:DDE-type integrase/transposase/recombinase [Campylobacter sp. P0139]
MWIDSKSAADVLGVKYDALVKSVKRAEKQGKKFCTIKPNILSFIYSDGIGRGGKSLQIWLDDELIIEAIKRGVITDGVIKAKLLSMLNMRGNDTHMSDKSLRGIKESSKGKRTTELTKFSEFEIDEIRTKENSHKRRCQSSLGESLEQSFGESLGRSHNAQKLGYDLGQGESLEQSFGEFGESLGRSHNAQKLGYDLGQGESFSDMDSAPNVSSFSTNECRLKKSSETKLQGDRYVGYKERAKTDAYGAGDGDGDVGDANSFMDSAWGMDSCADGSGNAMARIQNGDGFKGVDGSDKGDSINGGDSGGGGTHHSVGATWGDYSCADGSVNAMARIQNGDGFKSIKEELYEDLGDDGDSRDNSAHSTHNIRSRASASDIEALFNDLSVDDSKKADALLKAKIVKMWLRAKESKGIKIDAFLSYININKMYDKRVSKGQLYDWCKKYSIGGIHGLVDERGGNKPTLVESMGICDKVDELILSSKGKINTYNIYNRLHHSFVNQGLLTHEEFIRKEKEIIPYTALNRYVNRWKKAHPTEVLYIEKGYDAAINSKLAAVGEASWSAGQVNEYVEIDATTLDMFAKKIDLDLAKAIYEMNKNSFKDLDECKARVEENQKRYTVVGLIDRYSGVCSYAIGKSENIHTVKRALAKYIAKFGLPQTIIGDNGKAFKSHEMAGTFESLDIEYRAVRAYSGWLKPYIERSWRSFQDNFSQNLAGFIGHSVEQRQAIEFGYSKMERRLKKGQKTNLKEMLFVEDLEDLIDRYVDGFINARWIDRLGATPNDIFKRDGLEVKRLSALAVNARLGQLISKKVYKKGIMHDNSYFINSKIYAYDEVKIVANLNNSDEIYIWSCEGEFIGVGVRFDDGLGVSAEIAREARNYSKRKIDNARAKANEAARINQDSFVEYVKSVSVDSSVAVEYADEQGLEIEREHKRAKSLKAMSVNLIPTKKKPKRKEYSWEDLAHF